MPKELKLDDDKLIYGEEIVGSHTFVDGTSKVVLNLTFETKGEWIIPISYLARGLSELPENVAATPEIALEVETDEDDVEILNGVMRSLDEKTVKGNGYTWRFHKNDADPWPSELHGHDYERGVKLDAVDGRIYDIRTKNHCETLREKGLKLVQAALRASDDFKEKVARLVGS